MTRPLALVVLAACLALRASAAPPDAPVRPRLTKGSTGDAVRVLQFLLNETRRIRGQDRIGADGRFGPKTEQALVRFQRLAGVAADGAASPRTWEALLRVNERQGVLGKIDPTGPVGTKGYRINNEGPEDVLIHSLPEQQVVPGRRVRPLLFVSKFAIDADGAGDAYKSDPWGQPETSLQWGGGRSLDPTKTPFYVLPIGFDKVYPGIRLGDLAAVVYRGKVSFAIFGDRGPKTKIGEGSILLAQELGIDADPKTGGVGGGVAWIVFPGSGTGRPLQNDLITARGRELFRAAGGRLEQPKRSKRKR